MSETNLRPVARTGGRVAPANGAGNRAVDLANSLGGLNQNLRTFGLQFTDQVRQAQETRARNDAQTAEGRAFKKAIEDGVIEKTQNPFYIREFERQSAAVRGRQALNDIRVQSLEWPERDDPEAFAQRWSQALGEATSEGFESFDMQRGLEPVVAEVTNQVLNANVSRNVQRIEQSREANAGAVLAQRLAELNQQAAGDLSAADAFAGVEDLREQYIAVGGSEEEWDGLLTQAVTTVGYGQSDSDILDILRTPTGEGQTAIFNRPGVADQIENDRFRIQNQARRQASLAEQQDFEDLRARGREAEALITERMGRNFILGRVGPEQVFETLQAEGFTNSEIRVAMNSLQDTVSSSRSWSRAMTGSGNALDRQSFDLWLRASEEGLSDDIIEQARRVAEQGNETDARRIIEAGRKVDRNGEQSSKAARALDSQTELNARVNDITLVFEDDIEQLREGLSNHPDFVGIDVPFADTAEVERRMRAAAARVMTDDPSAFREAFEAAQDAKADAINEYVDQLQQLRGGPSEAPQQQQPTGGNPRR